MLIDDLRSTLRDHADMVDAVPGTVLDGIERKRVIHRRRRFAAATGGTVLVTAAVTVGALLPGDAGSSNRKAVSVGGSGAVPCAEPARNVPNFLDWPCPTGPVSAYERQEFAQMRQWGGLGSHGNAASDKFDFRVLAFGPVPHSRQSSSFVFAEDWLRDGSSPVLSFISYASLDTLYPFPQARPPTGAPLQAGSGGGPMPAGDPAMFVAAPPSIPRDMRTTLKACNRRIQRPMTRPTGYVTACTDMVLVRAGITAIRVVQPHGQMDPAIPVTSGVAGLERFAQGRRGWSIQGLDANGKVVATVPYKTTI
jgi:hypothetical protein